MKPSLPMPTGVLFDFDGVIVDSFQSHFNAWNTAHKELFSQEISHFPHEKLSGKSPHIIAQHFCDEAGFPEKASELFLKKGECLHNSTTPPDLLPGVREIQEFLASKETPHGIASNATRAFVKNSVAQLALGFTTCFGLEDYKKPKPAPEAYITLATALGISKEDYKSTWVFEDSITGTQSALKAGMLPIGILTMNSEEKMLAAGSAYCFPTLLEAYQYLIQL
ncbi:HAD family phosphatase [Flavicella sp.]|uniref:HAD family hydrolase n=1 Tax=Flavicella sp. TaxID=2957742 RepID=UPI00262E9001|nr:HAD family phosphatase [Flavicella sp.]MDG1804815.1 HAD family phosphatase [Flavicella sp.]MDG2280646.1 HAD family phosphatase [Flavicella sp.]